MNKIALRKYIDNLRKQRIQKLREKRAKEWRELCVKYATDFYEANKVFINQFIHMETPEIPKNEGVYIRCGIASLIGDINRFQKEYEDTKEEWSHKRSVIEIIAENVQHISYRGNDTKPYRDFEVQKSLIDEEFNKLQGNLKSLNGKEGTAYCIEQGIPIPNPEKAKNEILAPIDVSIIKGK